MRGAYDGTTLCQSRCLDLPEVRATQPCSSYRLRAMLYPKGPTRACAIGFGISERLKSTALRSCALSLWAAVRAHRLASHPAYRAASPSVSASSAFLPGSQLPSQSCASTEARLQSRVCAARRPLRLFVLPQVCNSFPQSRPPESKRRRQYKIVENDSGLITCMA